MRKASLIMMLFGVLTFGMTSCSEDSKQEEIEYHEGDHNHDGEQGHDHKADHHAH